MNDVLVGYLFGLATIPVALGIVQLLRLLKINPRRLLKREKDE